MDNSTLVSDTSAEVGAELVDERIIKQLIHDTSAEVIPILIDHYVEESRTRLAAIRHAATNNDAQALEFEVHTIGSTALVLGNRPLSVLSRTLEKQCLKQEYDAAFLRVEELLELADRSIKALLKRKNEGFS